MSVVQPQALKVSVDVSRPTDEASRGYGITRVFPIFSVVFAAVYFFGVYTGYGPIRYYPLIGQWTLSALPSIPDPGPVMMWYGWVLNGFIAAALVSIAALLLPSAKVDRFAERWVWVPLAFTLVLIAALLILLSGYFTA